MKTRHSTRCVLAGLVAAQVTLAAAHDDGDRGRDREVIPLQGMECRNHARWQSRKREPLRGIWLAGDTHAHTDHSSDGSLPRQQSGQRSPGNLSVADQIAQAERTGLDFLPLTDHRTYDQHWDPQYASSGLLLIPGEEANGSPHAVVLGAVDQIVDGANPPGSPAFRHLQQSIWDAHSQSAVWSVAHPDNGEIGPNGVPNDNASAVGANLVEVYNPASSPDAQMDYAENRWNRGFRFGVAAASDNHFRELWDVAGPGRPTTWVFAADRSQQAVLDALRSGRTSVSRSPSGPFVTIEADVDGSNAPDVMAGDEAQVRAGRTLQLRVRVKNGVDTSVYVFRSPGRAVGPLAVYKASSADQTFLLPVKVPEGASWYRAEVRSPGALPGQGSDPTLPDQLRAATSPIFISTADFAHPQPEIALPAVSIRDDHAVPVFDSRDCFTSFADTAVTNDTTHIVAEVQRNGRASIIYRRIEDDRRYDDRDGSNLFDLTPQSRSARFPKIAAAGRDVWVVWQDAGDEPLRNASAIYLRHSNDGGRHWQREVQLSDAASRATQPAIALVNADHPIVAWTDRADGPFDIRAQIIGVDRQPLNVSGAGKTIDAGTVLDTRSPRYPASLYPAIAVTPKGEIALVWQDNRFDPDPLWTGHTPPPGQAPSGGTDPDNWEILVSTRAPGTQRWKPAVRVSANDVAADRHPSIVAHGHDDLIVAWDTRELRSSGVNLSIRASRSADHGLSWSAPVGVGIEPTAMSQRPRLDVDCDGMARAVWYDSRSSDWRWQLFASALEESGAWTQPVQLTSGGNSTWPAVSRGVVVFTSDRRSERTQRDLSHEIFVLRCPRGQ